MPLLIDSCSATASATASVSAPLHPSLCAPLSLFFSPSPCLFLRLMVLYPSPSPIRVVCFRVSRDAPFASIPLTVPSFAQAANRVVPAFLISAEADRSAALQSLLSTLRTAVLQTAANDAYVCLVIQRLMWAVEQQQQQQASDSESTSTRGLVNRLTSWLSSIISEKEAKRHMANYSRSKRIYACEADHNFWEQLLRAHAVAPPTAPVGFTMSLFRFFHSEYDNIAQVYRSTEARHELWKAACTSRCQLQIVVLQIGQELAKHKAAGEKVFKRRAQQVYEQQLSSEGRASASGHAKALRIFDADDDADEGAAGLEPEEKHPAGAVHTKKNGSDQEEQTAEPSESICNLGEDEEGYADGSKKLGDDIPPARRRSKRKSTPSTPEAGKFDCFCKYLAYLVSLVAPSDSLCVQMCAGSVCVTAVSRRSAVRHRSSSSSSSRSTRGDDGTASTQFDEEGQAAAPAEPTLSTSRDAVSLIEFSRPVTVFPVSDAGEQRDTHAPHSQQKMPMRRSCAMHDSDDRKQHGMDAPVIVAGAAFTFDPAVAIEPVALDRPLDTCLPFHPLVTAHLAKYGIAVVSPTFSDQLGLLQAMNPKLLQHDTYSHAYRMSLGCINEQEDVGDPVQPASADGAHPLAPSADAVFDFLEKQWAHMSDPQSVGPLPRHPATENRIYLKDMSATHDVRRASTKEGATHSSSPSPSQHCFSFFPTLDQQLASILNTEEPEGESWGEGEGHSAAMETDEGVNEQLQPEDGDGDDDGNEIVRHLLPVRERARRIQAAICAVRRGRGAGSPSNFLFHPLYQGLCRKYSHASLRHTAMPTHTHTSWLL